ncbi:alpha subunit of pyruvate dehydrogenase, partial [Gryganskiella cystojenkinii]
VTRSFATTSIMSASANGDPVRLKLGEDSFKTFNCDPPSLDLELPKKDLVDMYKSMVTMRRLEMTADGLYKAKFIRGFCHLCTGQEAVGVGMESALTLDDKLITAYRSHGFTLMRGGSLVSILGELLGRKAGISSGKGGSMHTFTPRFFGGNGIVGAQVPLGTGIAFAEKYLNRKSEKNPTTTFVIYGDGAANQGQVFESFNMAKLWELPAVFVCENNQYGMGTSVERASANTEYYQRGDYIPGLKAICLHIIVDGMDALAVHQATKYAKEWTNAGKGPLLMEVETYRYGGHSMSDPGTTYRSREEIQKMRANNDPITHLRDSLVQHKILSEDELKALDKEVRTKVEKAAEEAKASPEPDLQDFSRGAYVRGHEVPFLRGREPSEVYRFKNNGDSI